MSIHENDKNREPEHEHATQPPPAATRADPDPGATRADPDGTPEPAKEPATARPDPIAPAVLFLLRQAKVQNRDLTNIANEHMRNIGNESAAPGPPSEGDPLRQSRRFRGRS